MQHLITLLAASLVFVAIALPISNDYDTDDYDDYGDYYSDEEEFPEPECTVVNGTKLYIDGEFRRYLNATEQKEHQQYESQWRKVEEAFRKVKVVNDTVNVNVDIPEEPEFCRHWMT